MLGWLIANPTYAAALGKNGDTIIKGAEDIVDASNVGKAVGDIQVLPANEIRFSQNTVSNNKINRVTGEKYTYSDLVESMKKDGWNGDPVDVVKMSDGAITSFDNTRILAAREAGIDVKANIHSPKDLLPVDMVASGRFGNAKTWGEAINNRISTQRPSSFATDNPNGTLNSPKITGIPK